MKGIVLIDPTSSPKSYLTLFYTRGLGIVVSHVMVALPYSVGDTYCLGGVLWKHRRLLTAEYVTNNFSRRYTTQQWQLEAGDKE
jgi:hypothetical protein